MLNVSRQARMEYGIKGRAGEGKAGRNRLLNVSRLRKRQGTPTIQQRNISSLPNQVTNKRGETAIEAT